jgi:hypothetical protein
LEVETVIYALRNGRQAEIIASAALWSGLGWRGVAWPPPKTRAPCVVYCRLANARRATLVSPTPMTYAPRMPRHTLRFSILCAILPLAAAGACGASGAQPDPAPASAATGGARAGLRVIKPEMRGDLEHATVYDARGQSKRCDAPRPECPPEAPERAFLDHCRLSGYQIRLCGCESMCTGNAAAAPMRYYNASGGAQECIPAKEDCTPAVASAAFQDACTEKGHHLQMCDCQWLCSGKPSAP